MRSATAWPASSASVQFTRPQPDTSKVPAHNQTNLAEPFVHDGWEVPVQRPHRPARRRRLLRRPALGPRHLPGTACFAPDDYFVDLLCRTARRSVDGGPGRVG
jgi:hypothetical protein